MREIKFRGKTTKGKWLYGDFIHQDKFNYAMIKQDNYTACVDEDTVGQYTGLKDKNGVEIYEGDIVNCYDRNFIVEFRKERGGFFPFACGDGCGCCEDEVISSYGLETSAKVIGNIYDNPKLLMESD